MAYVVRPERYFVNRLLWLANLHLSGEGSRGGGNSWGRLRKEAEAEKKLGLTLEFMADMGSSRWFVKREPGEMEEKGTVESPVLPSVGAEAGEGV